MLVGQLLEDSFAASNVLQLPLLSHSRCPSNAALARGGLSVCFFWNTKLFKLGYIFAQLRRSKDNPHMIYLFLPYVPFPFLLLSFSFYILALQDVEDNPSQTLI